MAVNNGGKELIERMKMTFSRLLNVVLVVVLLASVFLMNTTTSRSNVTNIALALFLSPHFQNSTQFQQ